MNKGCTLWTVVVMGIFATGCTVEANAPGGGGAGGGGGQPASSAAGTQPSGGARTSEQIQTQGAETCTSMCNKIQDDLACEGVTPEKCLSECNQSLVGPCGSQMLDAMSCLANGELTCTNGKLAPKDASICMSEIQTAMTCMENAGASSGSGSGSSSGDRCIGDFEDCSSDSECCSGTCKIPTYQSGPTRKVCV